MLVKCEYFFELGPDAFLKATLTTEEARPLVVEIEYDARGVMLTRRQKYLKSGKEAATYLRNLLKQHGS